MAYSVFNDIKNDQLKEPMFFGQNVNVARYDQQKYETFEKLIEKQLSFFWRPEEIDVSKDRIDYASLPEHEKHIFISNLKYQCLVEGTEVLTKNGWVDMVKYNPEIDGEILIYDLEKEQTKWELPKAKITKKHTGKVIKFAANVESQFIQIVTPEHRMPYRSRKSLKKYFVEAKDMEYKNTVQAPISGDFVSESDTKLTSLERLIIATQADGCMYERYTGALSGHIPILFSFSKKRKIERLKNLASEVGFELKFCGERVHKSENALNTEVYRLYVPVEYSPQDWKDFNKCFNLDNKSKEWALDFCDETINWDGCRYPGNTASNYTTTVRSNIDFVQSVAVLAGYSPRLTIRNDHRSEKHKDAYTIRFIDTKFKNGESINKTELDYDGLVSCVTVSTGAFVVRYNNCVSVTGNCLLDSVQGRGPNAVLLPIASIPELETWITTWDFSESIHSRSYTHIIRNVVNDPSIIFDDIVENPEIKKRAKPIAKYYDDLILESQLYQIHGNDVWYREKEDGTVVVANNRDELMTGEWKNVTLFELKRKLYLCLQSINALEAIRFYVSFACSFNFAERGLMEGNAKIIKLIARDEALHLTGTQHILNIMASGIDDPDFAQIAEDCKEESIRLFQEVVEQEKEWAKYLFKDGSMVGLNEEILTQYVEYIANIRMNAIGLGTPYSIKNNPIPWINAWLTSDNVQVAPQEVEISSYLVGQIDAQVDTTEFGGFEL